MDYLISFITAIDYFGYIVLFLIIFFESFPVTFFLPGDSLLFTTGFLASQGYFNFAVLVGTLYLASVLGYMFSYAMGQKLREIILKSNDRYWFKKKHLDYTEEFYGKYGERTIIIGRFVPIVRSFAPTLAGSVKMQYRKFVRDTLIGGFFWIVGVASLGFYLGKSIPQANLYLTPIVIGIILLSLSPAIIGVLKKRLKKDRLYE